MVIEILYAYSGSCLYLHLYPLSQVPLFSYSFPRYVQPILMVCIHLCSWITVLYLQMFDIVVVGLVLLYEASPIRWRRLYIIGEEFLMREDPRLDLN